ncbi:MAG: hypothetical protein OHK0039_35670 [Bacteroidia bacterium]
MMRSLLWVLLSLLALPASAQLYSNPVTLSLATTGSSTSTVLRSSQLAGRYTCDNGKLELMMKTITLAAGATADQQTLVHEVLMPDANPLLLIEAHLSSYVSCQQGTETQTVFLPVSLHFNGQVQRCQAHLTLTTTAQELRMNLLFEVSLAKTGLPVPAAYGDRVGDTLVFSVEDAALSRR